MTRTIDDPSFVESEARRAFEVVYAPTSRTYAVLYLGPPYEDNYQKLIRDAKLDVEVRQSRIGYNFRR